MAKSSMERALYIGLCFITVLFLIFYTSSAPSLHRYYESSTSGKPSQFPQNPDSVLKSQNHSQPSALNPPSPPYPTTTKVHNGTQDFSFPLPDGEPDPNDDGPIPNIVHYVWMILDRPEIKFGMREFISMYSAHLYWKPNAIYIHTDASPEIISHAKLYGDQWTRRILQLPNLQINRITVPTHTRFGRLIEKVEAKSDFIRTSALVSFGGVYIDTDVIPIRPITPLLHSGFANVVGLQLSEGGDKGSKVYWHSGVWNQVNTGIVMSKKNSILMRIFQDGQHAAYDGGWATHAVDLLTNLCFCLAPMPREVLIMPKQAFSPSSWFDADKDVLFATHDSATPVNSMSGEILPAVPSTLEEARDYWREMRPNGDGEQRYRKERWETDYSGSYMIHAFDNTKSWASKITLGYVLSRKSNYARAVYPAVWHAIENGIVDVEGEGTGEWFEEMKNTAARFRK